MLTEIALFISVSVNLFVIHRMFKMAIDIAFLRGKDAKEREFIKAEIRTEMLYEVNEN